MIKTKELKLYIENRADFKKINKVKYSLESITISKSELSISYKHQV